MSPADGAADPDVSFEPARTADLDDLVAIDAASLTPWNAAAFAEETRHESPTLFVLREGEGGAPIAFVAVRVQTPEMDIVNLAVAPSRRRRGMGAILVRRLLEAPVARGVEAVHLEVRAGNEAALALYRRLGFEATQRRRNFYREPVEDALLMTLRMSHRKG